MGETHVNNKRIAKNTLLLYIRTLFVMFISLYTSRVILEALGIDDYGIYQVVGGLVTMFSIISSSLTTAISRFITFEIGTGNKDRLKKIFSTSISIQLIIAIVILIATEIVGIWFMETKMQIPADRIEAAKWVLHLSCITFCINLLSIPYNACIIAYERMSTFAYISVLEAVAKLLICYLITISPYDRLISYATLMLLVAISIRCIYTIYCRRNFEESCTGAGFDKSIFKEMIGFSGWSFFNNSASILNNQGVNMLMNVHFGVIVNAARGIANQVEAAVLQFVNNFTTAINPQITKCYAVGDLDNLYKLVYRGAKFSYFSMLLLAMPIIIEANQILSIWLIEVPDYTAIFVQLSLVMGMCDSIGNSGYTACIATGKLKKYSITITSIAILEFILTWLFFSYGAPPTYAYFTYIAVKIAILIVRMYLLKSMVGMKVNMYVKNVLAPILLTTIASIAIPLLVCVFMKQTLLRIPITVFVSFISVIISSLYLGMSANERDTVLNKFSKLLRK